MLVNNSDNLEVVMSHKTNEMNSSCFQNNCDCLKLINGLGNKRTIKSASGRNLWELTNVCYISVYFIKDSYTLFYSILMDDNHYNYSNEDACFE